MGLAWSWATAAYVGVLANAGRMWPVVGLIFAAEFLRIGIRMVPGIPEALDAGHVGVALAVGIPLSLVRSATFVFAYSQWDPGGRARTASQALESLKGRWREPLVAAVAITLAWELPLLLGAAAALQGATGVGFALMLVSVGAIFYVAGLRYVAVPIALQEGLGGFRALRESRRRLWGLRKDVAKSVFLIVLPWWLAGLPIAILALTVRHPAWPLVVETINSLEAVFVTCALGRLGWHVYKDVGQPTATVAPSPSPIPSLA